MNGKMESILNIMECCLKHDQPLTPKSLSIIANVSEVKARCILSTLQKKGYFKKNKGASEYALTENIMTLL